MPLSQPPPSGERRIDVLVKQARKNPVYYAALVRDPVAFAYDFSFFIFDRELPSLFLLPHLFLLLP
jgi:hypothetical protein